MREHWDKALSEIDEKFISETAETHAKNAKRKQEHEANEQELYRPLVLKPDNAPKKSRKGMIIGFSAAAAAVVALGVVGVIMLSRGNSNQLLPSDTSSGDVIPLSEPFDAANYSSITCVCGEIEMQLTDFMISDLSDILDKADKTALDGLLGPDESETAYLSMQPKDSGDPEVLWTHEVNGNYYYSIAANGNTAYFELSEETYNDLISWFMNYTPTSFTGTVIETDDLGNTTDPENGFYLVEDPHGGVYAIYYDERFAVGDTIKVIYYGGIMETYPAQVRVYEIEKFDSDVVSINSAFVYNNISVTLEYIPVETDSGIAIREPNLYVIDENATVRFDENSADLAVEMRPDSRPFLRELELDGGSAFAVMIPENGEAEDTYRSYFYLYNGSELCRFTNAYGKDFTPLITSTRLYCSDTEDIVSFVIGDGTSYSYYFDCETLKAAPADVGVSESAHVISFDEAKAGFEGMGILIQYFMGKWGSEKDTVDITLRESPFTYADPLVGCYKDAKGYFMLAEDRAWYILSREPNVMYYFENITDGQQIETENCTAVYRNLSYSANEGYYGANGEYGYLGYVDLSVTLNEENPIEVSDFFNMEVTDVNGKRWIRTPDKSIDWGGFYEVTVNKEKAYCFKMQNADDPSEMKYISFSFIPLREKLTWTDEHYCLDTRICSTKEYPTYFASESELSAMQHGYGFFVVETWFSPCSDGSYYAYRLMGNNQSQWLVDAEYFYHDGTDYKLISDELGPGHTEVANDKLYVLYNTDTGLGLNIYRGTERVCSIDICHGDKMVQMGTWGQMHGKYYVMTYYDVALEKYVYAVLDTEASEPTVEYYEELQFDNKGDVIFPGG